MAAGIQRYQHVGVAVQLPLQHRLCPLFCGGISVRPFFEGDKVVERHKTRCVLIAVAACLAASASGCKMHRTDRGFMVRSQWSLEYGNTDGMLAQGADKPPEGFSSASTRPDAQAQAKPEVLPWHSRLREHRIAARLFHQGEAGNEKQSTKGLALADSDSSRSCPPPPATPVLPESPRDEGKPTNSVKPACLQIPSTELTLPESRPPDLVLN
jgi:hypothetical protein